MSNLSDLPPEATMPTGRTELLGGGATTGESAEVEAANQPDYERPELQRMRPKWELPDLLLGGTVAMQEAGEKVLIKEQDETEDEFKRRRQRTVLTNYYGNTLHTHSGMPFASPITFDPPLPERLSYLERDADGCGKSITVFARDFLRDAMHRGVSHVLVDVPRGQGESYADTLKRQPRLVHIEAGSLLGVDDAPAKSGEDVVSYMRFRQTKTVDVGKFGQKPISVILEIAVEAGARGTVVEYRRNELNKWGAEEESPYTRDSIPLFTLYAEQTGEYEGEPAYRYLAELNLAHYQSDADQRHALSYGRRATVIQTGWKAAAAGPEAAAQAAAGNSGVTKRDALGYGRKMRSSDPDAKAYLLETNGAPLSAGRDDLQDLEQRMERFGAQQVSKDGGITARSRELDNARDTCNLEAWCTRLECVLLHAIRAVAEWLGFQLPDGQKVNIDRSFAADGPKAETFPHVLALMEHRALAPVDALREAIARGIVTTITDPEDAIARVNAIRQQDAVASMEAEIFRQRQAAADATVTTVDAPADAPAETTLNEIALGIERLARIGDGKMLQALREQLAEKIGVASPGKFVAPKPKAPAPMAVGAP